MIPAPPHPRLDRPARERPPANETETFPINPTPPEQPAPEAVRPDALVTLARARRVGLIH
jgi:hypothetical protein